jgi:hypothetical protein
MSLYIYMGKLSHDRASGHSAGLTLNYGLISEILALIIKIICKRVRKNCEKRLLDS